MQSNKNYKILEALLYQIKLADMIVKMLPEGIIFSRFGQYGIII